MKARRKARRSTESDRKIERLRKANKRLRRLLKEEQARWWEKCPQGHLVRHDKCDLMCWVVTSDPVTTPLNSMLPKTTSEGLLHDWYDPGTIELGKPLTPEAKEKLLKAIVEGPPSAAVVAWGTEKQTGWWIRIPYGWWLKLKGWFRGSVAER